MSDAPVDSNDARGLPLTLPSSLEIPPSVEAAALMGRLTFFIGNGVSRLYGLPSWDELANEMLRRLAKHGHIDYNALELLSRRATKVKISIADSYFKESLKSKGHKELTYKSILSDFLTKEKMQSVPVYGAIARCRVKFITTNYDQILVNFLEGQAEGEPIQNSILEGKGEPSEVVGKATAKKVQVFNAMSEIRPSATLDNNVVFHIHGSVADEESIVASTESYLQLYGTGETKRTLESLLAKQTVVFIGYGLDEMELLDLIVRASKSDDISKSASKFYLLLPLLTHEAPIQKHLKKYFHQLGIEVLDFCCDRGGFHALGEVLEAWASRLAALSQEPTLLDQTEVIDRNMTKLDELTREK